MRTLMKSNSALVSAIFVVSLGASAAFASDVPNIPVEWTTLTNPEPPGASTGPTVPEGDDAFGMQSSTAIYFPGGVNIAPLLNPPSNPPQRAMGVSNQLFQPNGPDSSEPLSLIPVVGYDSKVDPTFVPSHGAELPSNPVNPIDTVAKIDPSFISGGNHWNPMLALDLFVTVAKINPNLNPGKGAGLPKNITNPTDTVANVDPFLDSNISIRLPSRIVDPAVVVAWVPQGTIGTGLNGGGVKGPKGPPSPFGL